MTDRYHRAARDGLLDILKEANRKECNTKDDDGMTPTLWASFEGNLEALRLLVGRGGNPEKCDNYGNTALHFAAARGHMNCVTFLLSYGVNIYAKDIDYHTAKELAAMQDRQEILRYLDDKAAAQARSEPKKVKSLMAKADKDADKRVKEFARVQEKARKLAEKEKKRLEKERKRMEVLGHHEPTAASAALDQSTVIPRPSMAALNLRRDSRLIYSHSPKFSEIVSQKEEKDRIKLPVSTVYRKVQQQRRKLMNSTVNSRSGSLSKTSSLSTLNNNNGASGAEVLPGDFKVGAIEDGKRSVSSISGLRRDSEVMYVPRPGLDGVFPDSAATNAGEGRKSISGRSVISNGEYLIVPDKVYGRDDDEAPAYQPPRSSIFERPGFGGLAFRNSIAALVETTPMPTTSAETSVTGADIIDATTLNQNQRERSNHYQDELESEEDEDEGKTPMHFFLSAVGLEEFVDPFVKEKFDLDSLMLVGESDLVAMGIPRGHRLKLMRAIAERKAALEAPEEDLEDSHL